MSLFRRLIAPLAGLAALPASAAPPPAPRPDLNPAIWVAKDADTTVYLFGTVHALDGKGDWFNDEIKRSFDRSQELVLEVVLPEDPATLVPLVQKVGILDHDQGFDTLVVELRERFRKTVRIVRIR